MISDSIELQITLAFMFCRIFHGKPEAIQDQVRRRLPPEDALSRTTYEALHTFFAADLLLSSLETTLETQAKRVMMLCEIDPQDHNAARRAAAISAAALDEPVWRACSLRIGRA